MNRRELREMVGRPPPRAAPVLFADFRPPHGSCRPSLHPRYRPSSLRWRLRTAPRSHGEALSRL